MAASDLLEVHEARTFHLRLPMSLCLAALSLTLALVVPTLAAAKSSKQMSESELIAVLGDPGGVRKKIDAMEELGVRNVEGAADVIGAACLAEAELCETALAVLGRYGSGEALDQTELLLSNISTPTVHRSAALELLLEQDPERLDTSMDDYLAWYRHNDPVLTIELLGVVEVRNLKALGDMVVFMAKDLEADRDVRLAAMGTAEQLEHPRLYDVYLSFLDDTESSVRSHAAEALGGKGYPGAELVPALRFAAMHDSAGVVRSSAFLSLRFYAHADLLPVVNHAAIHEANPMAWGCAILMLEALADRSSVHPIHEVLKRREQLEPATQIQLIHVLVRIGDLAAVPVLHVVLIRSNDESIKQAALDAIDLLQGSSEQRASAVSRWTFGVGVYTWDPDVPRAPRPPLRVMLDEADVLVWVD